MWNFTFKDRSEKKKKMIDFNFSLSREFKTSNYITLKIRC